MGVSVLVMAKAPRAGSVKTRLEPLLGPDGCARLQRALIEAVTAWAADVSPGGAYLAFEGPEHELRPHIADGVRGFADTRGDLGDRLAAATAHVFRERSEPLLVVGTDMPVLTRAHAREAEAVLRGGADVAFGPAVDGGYWMVGLARPAPDVFELGGDWGSAAVLERSLERCAAAGLRAELLGTQRDLDDAADARALAGHPRLPPAVAEILAAA
jgi:rSAM/selenodomain-associated transferase 1